MGDASGPSCRGRRSARSACSRISSPRPGMVSLPPPRRVRNALLYGEAGVLPGLFLLLILLLALTQPRFLAATDIVNGLRSASFPVIAASGRALVLIVGVLDLSIGRAVRRP